MLTRVQSSNCRSVAVLFIISLLLLCVTGVGKSESSDIQYQGSNPCDYIDELLFNSTAANASIAWQTDLGPRLPGSNASEQLRESIIENLAKEFDKHLNITSFLT